MAPLLKVTDMLFVGECFSGRNSICAPCRKYVDDTQRARRADVAAADAIEIGPRLEIGTAFAVATLLACTATEAKQTANIKRSAQTAIVETALTALAHATVAAIAITAAAAR